jgi:hypothetical protein
VNFDIFRSSAIRRLVESVTVPVHPTRDLLVDVFIRGVGSRARVPNERVSTSCGRPTAPFPVSTFPVSTAE